MAYHLTHPETSQEIEVEADMVPVYISAGWETKPNAKPVATPEPKVD